MTKTVDEVGEWIRALPRFTYSPAICGVYFLFDGEEIVYVGQSIDVIARVNEHERDRARSDRQRRTKMAFDSFAYMRIDPKLCSHVERKMISYLNPRYNRGAGGEGARANRKVRR